MAPVTRGIGLAASVVLCTSFGCPASHGVPSSTQDGAASSALHGDSGPAALPGADPNLSSALGVGFDLRQTSGDGAVPHVSLHFSGVEYGEVADPGFDIASGEFHSARVSMTRAEGGALVTVAVTPAGAADEIVVFDSVFVGGLELNEGRIAFSGQTGSGGDTADHDIDNVTLSATAAADPKPVITLGEEVSGSIAQGRALDRYDLVLTERTLIAFDSLTNENDLVWYIAGPGAEHGVRSFLAGQRFNVSDANSGRVIMLEPGQYEIRVGGRTPTFTGSYAFRILDLFAGDAIELGAQVDGQLAPGNSSAVYTFAAEAGQPLYFDFLSTTDGNMDWSAYTPDGLRLFGVETFDSSDPGARTAPVTGTYALLIAGRIHRSNAIDYSFRVADATASTAALTVGELTAGTIAAPG